MAEKIQITPEQIELVQKLAGQGLKTEQMAAIIGISKATFDRRMADMPGLAEAIEKGRAAAAEAITQTAYRLALSGRHPAMTMFWLKCRERWTEVQRFEHTGADGKPIESKSTTQLPDEQLDARIQALIQKGGTP